MFKKRWSNAVYDASSFDYAMVGGARIVNKDGSLRFEYSLKDHLGNTRAVYTDADGDGDAELLQEEAYYPFGMRIPSLSKSYSGSSDDKHLYNGKELEDRIEGFHFYDFGARFYAPALARWHSVDPLAEKGRQWSPYTYVFNNPMNFTDPDGRWGRLTNWVSFFVNWLGLNGNENDEKRELPKDELASNKNISEEGIAGWIALPEVEIESTSSKDGSSGENALLITGTIGGFVGSNANEIVTDRSKYLFKNSLKPASTVVRSPIANIEVSTKALKVTGKGLVLGARALGAFNAYKIQTNNELSNVQKNRRAYI